MQKYDILKKHKNITKSNTQNMKIKNDKNKIIMWNGINRLIILYYIANNRDFTIIKLQKHLEFIESKFDK